MVTREEVVRIPPEQLTENIDEVMERLEEKIGLDNIYRTDEYSTIEFITDGRRLWVRVEG